MEWGAAQGAPLPPLGGLLLLEDPVTPVAAGLGKLLAQGQHESSSEAPELASGPRWRIARRWPSRSSAWAPPTCVRSSRRCGRGRRGTTTSGVPPRQRSASRLCSRARRTSVTSSRSSTGSPRTCHAPGIVEAMDSARSDRRSRTAGAWRWRRRRRRAARLMEPWMQSDDPDVVSVMKQNLSKKRMGAAGADWVTTWTTKLSER